ncbi:MAG: hypothetical protein HQ567_34770 [Candidatus Nealsonbacteria bacterium]|nr:hypothetical protein [Candidatus Nealsonbacteria bacterium]
MKSIHALMIAAVLGCLGALLNYTYLRTRSQEFEAVYFIGVERRNSQGEIVPIYQGDHLLKSDLKRVPVPKGAEGGIIEFAFPWSAAGSVKGDRVWRTIKEPRLLFDDDIKTPPQELDLPEGEAAIGVPIDTRTSTPSLIQPGQLVSFIISRARGGLTPDAGSAELVPFDRSQPGDEPLDDPTGDTELDDAETPVKLPTATVTIGKFRVLSLGNRLGSADVMRASRQRQVQENVMLISVQVTEDGELAEEKAQQLVDMLYATNFRQVGIILHSRKKAD